jgi:hypothetical protein
MALMVLVERKTDFAADGSDYEPRIERLTTRESELPNIDPDTMVGGLPGVSK